MATIPAGAAYDFLFKVIVVGPADVGKSSIIMQFTDRKFDPKMDCTIGVEFGAKVLVLANGKKAKLQLWDTAGQESFRSITNSYYRGAQAAFIVYDVTRFDQIPGWIEEVRGYAEASIVILLVGNKTDVAEKRAVTTAEGQEFATKHELLFIETSAKTGDGVDRAFENCCDVIIDRVSRGLLSSVRAPAKLRTVDDVPVEGGGGCCS